MLIPLDLCSCHELILIWLSTPTFPFCSVFLLDSHILPFSAWSFSLDCHVLPVSYHLNVIIHSCISSIECVLSPLVFQSILFLLSPCLHLNISFLFVSIHLYSKGQVLGSNGKDGRGVDKPNWLGSMTINE